MRFNALSRPARAIICIAAYLEAMRGLAVEPLGAWRRTAGCVACEERIAVILIGTDFEAGCVHRLRLSSFPFLGTHACGDQFMMELAGVL
jgi:hypothetical protein